LSPEFARDETVFSDPLALLRQLTSNEFCHAFGRAPLLLKSIPTAKPAHIGAMIWDIFVATKFAPGAVRMAFRGEVLQPQQKNVRGKAFIDPQKLVESLQLGHTLNIMGIERFRTDIRAVTSGLEERFEVPCPANLYVSYEGSTGGYGPHRDQHDVIVVHLYGEKVWKLYPPAERYVPIRKLDVTREDLRVEPIEFTMKSGSCLYVPAGFTHDVVSSEGCCVHITFGVQCLRWHDMLSDILGEIRSDVFFERIPNSGDEIVGAFKTRIAPALALVFNDESVSRMAERYEYFGSLAKHKQRVIRSIMSPHTSSDR